MKVLLGLKKTAAEQTNYYAARSLVYALGQGGLKGDRLLSELAASAEHNLKIAIDQFREGRFTGKKSFDFPELPRNTRLPHKLIELDEEVAYRESLPKTVTVDLKTPEATVRSFLLAMVVEDWTAYNACVLDNLQRQDRRDQPREYGEQLPRYKVGTIVRHSGDEAQAEYEFGDERNRRSGMLLLKKGADGWRVSGEVRPK